MFYKIRDNIFPKRSFRYILAFFALILSLVFLSNNLFAQNSYRNLALSDQYNEHYLSPYLTHYTVQNIQSVQDIVNNPAIQGDILNATGSILLLNFTEHVTWLSLEVTNRSMQEDWNMEFGSGFDGRFGLLNNIQVYTFNNATASIKEFSLDDNKMVRLKLAKDEQSQIFIRIEKTETSPTTIALKLLNAAKTNNNGHSTLQMMTSMFLIGMAFFFAAVAIVKFKYNYFYFSLYYFLLNILLYVQNNFIEFKWLFIQGEILGYLIFSISLVSLIIANLFWHPHEREFWKKLSFIIPFILSIISLVAAKFFHDDTHLLPMFLTMGPSIIILLTIPLVTIVQSESKYENTAPFMLGWFILLFGICITVLSLSGILQPVSTAINAFWFAIIPQAIFFVFASRVDVGNESEHITLSKTVEINESETISRLRQSKENTEQDRLLKVIEQERKVLGELRKSEARRAEEMRKAKELADDANKGKSAFLAVVSHEIRTPMTGIMGMVRMLLNSNLTKEQNEYAQTIQDSSDAMLALLNDILDFEKIEQGKMTFENISFDLQRLILGVATLMRGHAVQKGYDLTTKMGEDLPKYVMGDPTRLRQVLLNLTGNAVKFTQEHGVKIIVELMKKNDDDNSYEIYFGIIDNGIGISEEAKKDLFTPFSQADKSISRKFGGTGLGLAISKGLINGMGSDINISSTEGEGSTFFFTLNMKSGRKDDISHSPRVEIQGNQSSSKRILLIDDNHINRKVVRGLLSEFPYEIVEEENAEAGLKKLNDGKFDLILMDIELPDLNGDEATKRIRQSTNTAIKNIPVIALTGNTQDEQISHYFSCGINSYIAKPIDPTNLIKTIENATNGIFDSDMKHYTYTKKNTSDNNIILDKDISSISVDLTLDEDKPIEIIKAKKTESFFKPSIDPTLGQIKLIEIKPILDGTAIPVSKKENVFTGASLDITQPTTKTTAAKNPDEVLDLETLSSLKKHLPIDKLTEMIKDVFVKIDEIHHNLESAIKINETDKISSNCHDLKGMAGNFGLNELSLLGKEIEQKSKTQPTIIISTLINKIPAAKKRAQEALYEWSSQK